MLEPESGKPENLNTLLGSVATLFAALAGWFYRKAGQVPPVPPGKIDSALLQRELGPILAQLENMAQSLTETHTLAVDTHTEVIRMKGGFDRLSFRLAKVEGNQ